MKSNEFYEQCIHNPKNKNQFVTVEAIKHVPRVDYSVCKCDQEDYDVHLDQEFQNNYSNNLIDENPYESEPCEHKSHFKQRLYEQGSVDETFVEVQPDIGRNSKKRHIVSLWNSTEQGLVCQHSFFVPNKYTKIYKAHNN